MQDSEVFTARFFSQYSFHNDILPYSMLLRLHGTGTSFYIYDTQKVVILTIKILSTYYFQLFYEQWLCVISNLSFRSNY